MSEVLVVDSPEQARVLLEDTRIAILEHLADPGSAVSLSHRLDIPRQRLNYHLHELERAGLVEVATTRQRGSVTERDYRRTSAAFAISVAAIGRLGARPADVQDRFSSAYQIAVASQAVAELGAMREAAAKAKKTVPTLTMEAEVRFASPAKRSEFAQELSDAIAALIRKYHDERDPEGRAHRLYVGAYPKPKDVKG